MLNLGDPLTERVMRSQMEATHGRRRIRWRNVWPGLLELVGGLMLDACRWLRRHSSAFLVIGAALLVGRVLVDVLPLRLLPIVLVVAGVALTVYACFRMDGEQLDVNLYACKAPFVRAWFPGQTCERCPRVLPGDTELYNCPDCAGERPSEP